MAAKKNPRRRSAAKESTSRTALKKRIPARKTDVTASKSAQQTSPFSSISSRFPRSINRNYLMIALGILVLAGLLYLGRSLFLAAVVNGQPITRVAVISELEKQSGKQALDTLITKTLILQEARKQNVTVSQDEINAELKRIEDNVKASGQTLDEVLALQGMSRESLIEQIRIQKTVEKILGKQIQVTDKEVQDYISKNSETLGSDPNSQETKNNVKQQLTQQKLSEKFQTWLDDLKKKAKINYFVSY